jgi:hypothetical protein
MASQLSDRFVLVAGLRESARRGDWKNAMELALALRDLTPPASAIETGQYLDRLREALVAAKTSRAHTAATLVRINAAARFSRSRQEFGESPES